MSDAEDGLEVEASPFSPLLRDTELANTLSRDEVLEALNWPDEVQQAELDDGDPFGNGFAMG